MEAVAKSENNVFAVRQATLQFLALGVAMAVERSQIIDAERFIERAGFAISDITRAAHDAYVIQEWDIQGPFGQLPYLLEWHPDGAIERHQQPNGGEPIIRWRIVARRLRTMEQYSIDVGITDANDFYLMGSITNPFSGESIFDVNWQWQCNMPNFIEEALRKGILRRSFKDVLASETPEQLLTRKFCLEDY